MGMVVCKDTFGLDWLCTTYYKYIVMSYFKVCQVSQFLEYRLYENTPVMLSVHY